MQITDVWVWLTTFLASLWLIPEVQMIAYGVLLNVALSIAVALRKGVFSLRVLGDFLFTQLLPNIVVYVAFRLFSDGTGFTWVGASVFVLIEAQIVAGIIEKLSDLGVPIPRGVVQLVRRPLPLVKVSFLNGNGNGANGNSHR